MVPQSQTQNSSSPKCLNGTLTDSKSSSPTQQKNGRAQRKPGGWKVMPYILGNETFERLASLGLLANFLIYLRKVYHMNQVSATSLINVWSSVSNFAPLIGAFVSDAYLGRYYTIAIASMASLLGMIMMTLTAWLPQLHPPTCVDALKENHLCVGASSGQLGFLIMSLCFVSIGSAGIRPCSIPFGVDQFDLTTEKGRKGISSFYNWYYVSFTVILIFTSTVVVYIQDSVSWVLGYGIPTLLMFCSIIVFFLGTRVYVFVKPEGSMFTGLAQTAVSAYRKRKLKLPSHVGTMDRAAFYDPPLNPGTAVLAKLPLTSQFRFLNKGAVVIDKELNPDGTRVNKWNLITIQQAEEFKCLIRIAPIWLTGILSLVPLLQQATFSISQALQMDRHMGPKFEMPAASLNVILFLTIAIWIPVYDQIMVPMLRRVTKHENGISCLQRMGVGFVFSVLSMVVAGLVERERRAWAIKRPEAPISVFWLAPQYILMGMCEGFNIVGQIEFFIKEFPEHMRTMGNALSSCSLAFSGYISTAVILILHKTTGSHGKPDWLTDDLNAGKLDYFYFIVAGMAFINFFFFLYCAKQYQYKGVGELISDEPRDHDHDHNVELSSVKKLDV